MFLNSSKRLYKLEQPIVAITGGIASGKSTVVNNLEKSGRIVLSADAIVKKIYQEKSTISFIKEHAPQAVSKESINFSILREMFFSDKNLKVAVEDFIYPKMESIFKQSLNDESSKFSNDNFFIYYEIPLLFERDLQDYFDLVVVIATPEETQIERMIERDKNSKEIAKKIISSQLPMKEKIKRSHLYIDNSGDIEELKIKIQEMDLMIKGLLSQL